MRDDVKVCVSARVDFFSKYYDIPQSLQTEVDAFISDIEALGERCTDAQQFEAEFVSSGLSNRFNAILPKCNPKAMPVTVEQKAYSRQVCREMWQEQRGQIAEDIINDVTESVTMRIESDSMQARRRAMSDAGVLDDYTRATNAIDDAECVAGFFGRLFGRKKKQN